MLSENLSFLRKQNKLSQEQVADKIGVSRQAIAKWGKQAKRRNDCMGEKKERKYYLDNIRWATVLLVVVYHVAYNFNSVGVVSNIGVQGIPQMDVLLFFVYPWFMALLFLVAGVSARYSLAKRTNKQFLKERVRKLLVPSIAGIFILGWINGFVTSHYVNMFGENADKIPAFFKFIIYCFSGIGPLWFAHELFLASIVLVTIRLIDKKDKIWTLAGKTNYIALVVLLFFIWGSSMILNTPVITVYRNGIYIFMFLLGYYVFSHEEVTDLLVKIKIPMLIVMVITGVLYTMYYYGQNYTTASCLQSFFTNFYLWIAILAILGNAKAFCSGHNKFTDYMSKRSFAIYVLHNPFLVLISYLVVTYLGLPMIVNYGLILVLELLLLPVLYEVVSRIPVLRTLLLGM